MNPSIKSAGFVPIGAKRPRRLMMGSDGWPNTGKTEFAWSAPEPILHICLDRGYDAALDNPRPPATRGKDIAIKVVQAPLATQARQDEYVTYWKNFYSDYMAALSDPTSRTVIVDGDSDSWELQKLAEFGRLNNIPPLKLTIVNSARRAMYARAFDSGKVVIFTNKLKDGYDTKLNKNGDEVQVKNGREERQGFRDQTYLFQVQLRHLYNAEDQTWGVRIMMCKADTSLAGMELWGDDCNFKSLVSMVYPNVSLEEWGYGR